MQDEEDCLRVLGISVIALTKVFLPNMLEQKSGMESHAIDDSNRGSNAYEMIINIVGIEQAFFNLNEIN